MVILKNLLPGKSVSIAAPASYWYLKGFPIAQMSSFLDYIVFMTYDLHGQVSVNNYHQSSAKLTLTSSSHTHLRSGTLVVNGIKTDARLAAASAVMST